MAIEWISGSDMDGVEPPVAVAYTEKEHYGTDQCTASVVLDCRWEDRYLIRQNILDNLLVWPYNPGAALWIETIDIDPAPNVQTGQDGYGNTYLRARLSLNFLRRAGEGGGDPSEPTVRFAESIEVNGEMLKMPPDQFAWDIGVAQFETIKDEESPSMIVVGADYVVSWTGLTSIPAQAFSAVNKVNQSDVVSVSLGVTFQEETLLFNPPKISRTVTTDPAVNFFTMECRWSHRAEGWNKFWRAKDRAWMPMYIENPDFPESSSEFWIEYKPFQLVDMSDMLP